MTLQEKFAQPFDLTDRPNVYDLMPKYGETPKVDYKWEKAVSTWFFSGIEKSAFKVKDGIDANKAFQHLRSIIGSWLPKHEHKTEAAAFLMCAQSWMYAVPPDSNACPL